MVRTIFYGLKGTGFWAINRLFNLGNFVITNLNRHILHPHPLCFFYTRIAFFCLYRPADQSLDDWVAIHIQDFAHRAHLLNNLVVNSGKCNSQTCPDFRAGPIQYLWQDGEGFKVKD